MAVLARGIVQANFNNLPLPFKLLFVVTKECHSKCLNCNIWQIKPQDELSLDEIKAFAKNSNFLSWIDFTGGEPTDRRDFTEIIQIFRENCKNLVLVHFPTNGLKPEKIKTVCKEIAKQPSGPIVVVTVSIDGPPEVNDKLRGIPHDFDRALETYSKLCLIKGIKPYIGMTLYPENVCLVPETIASIKKQLPSFNARNLHFNLAHISDHYYLNQQSKLNDATTPSEFEQSVIALFKKQRLPLSPFQVLEHIYQRKVEAYLQTKKCPVDCTALLTSCYLSERGEVYPCSIWNKPLGNIRDSGYDLRPILQSPVISQLRTEILNKQCPNCWTPCEAYPSIMGNFLTYGGGKKLEN